jgi:hypothetical protein
MMKASTVKASTERFVGQKDWNRFFDFSVEKIFLSNFAQDVSQPSE